MFVTASRFIYAHSTFLKFRIEYASLTLHPGKSTFHVVNLCGRRRGRRKTRATYYLNLVTSQMINRLHYRNDETRKKKHFHYAKIILANVIVNPNKVTATTLRQRLFGTI